MPSTTFPYLAFARDHRVDYATVLRTADKIQMFRDMSGPELTDAHMKALDKVIAAEERRRRMVIFAASHKLDFDVVESAAQYMRARKSMTPYCVLRALTVDQRWQLFCIAKPPFDDDCAAFNVLYRTDVV